MPTITAVLKKWRLSQRIVSGIIKDSKSSFYKDGVFVTVNVDVVSHFSPEDFPKMEEREHWRIRDTSGRYFLIFKGDEWTSLGD
jgi:hypothetical protein